MVTAHIRKLPRRKLPRSTLPYRARGPLLSRGERAFFHALRAAVGGRFLIALKPRVADLLDCSAAAWAAGHGYRIARHHVDWVLCEFQSTLPVAAIELDDRSHDRPERKRRDQFLDAAFAAAGLPLIRFQAAARYQISMIRERVQSHLDSETRKPIANPALSSPPRLLPRRAANHR
jgi:Protein of unknown function (DUF2726)